MTFTVLLAIFSALCIWPSVQEPAAKAYGIVIACNLGPATVAISDIRPVVHDLTLCRGGEVGLSQATIRKAWRKCSLLPPRDCAPFANVFDCGQAKVDGEKVCRHGWENKGRIRKDFASIRLLTVPVTAASDVSRSDYCMRRFLIGLSGRVCVIRCGSRDTSFNTMNVASHRSHRCWYRSIYTRPSPLLFLHLVISKFSPLTSFLS